MTDDLVAEALALGEKLAGTGIEGTFTFRIEDEGIAVHVADGAVSIEDTAADVTVIATLDVFRDMMDGALSPTEAYMSGRMRIEGDVALAMKLGEVLG
jgi:putative sterol carrier protein